MRSWGGPIAEDEIFERFLIATDGCLAFAASSREPWQLEEVACAAVPPFLACRASDDLLDRMVAEIGTRPDGVSLLHVMGKLAMPLLAIKAKSAAEAAVDAGAPGPSALARRCGTLVPSCAWIGEEGGRVASIFFRMTRPGLNRVQAIGFAFGVEELGGGIFDAVLVEPMSEARFRRDIVGDSAAQTGVSLREAAVDTGIEALLDGCRRNIDVGLGPSDDALSLLNLVLVGAGEESREGIVTALGFLPPFKPPWREDDEGNEFVDVPKLTDDEEALLTDECERLVSLFNERVASREPDAQRRELAEFVGRMAIEYQAWQRDSEPWSGAMVLDFLLAYLPRKARFETEDIPLVPSTVGRVLRFVGTADERIGSAHGDALGALAERMAGAFETEIGNPANMGPAALLAEAMSSAGIDITDQSAVQAWLRDFNELPREEREAVLPDSAFPRLPLPPTDDEPGPAARSGASKRRRQAARNARKANRRRR